MKINDVKLLIHAIISQQEMIIGSIAVDQANHVNGLHVNDDLSDISYEGDSTAVLQDLVKQYEQLFGQASVEACRESVRQVLGQVDPKEVPAFLK